MKNPQRQKPQALILRFRGLFRYVSSAFGSAAADHEVGGPSGLLPSQDEVEYAIAILKGGKAVPKTSMPADVWKLAQQSMSVHSTAVIQTCQEEDFNFRQSWQIASCPCCQNQARPLAGLRTFDPWICKTPARKCMPRNRLLETVHQRLLDRTQYSYCPGKSIDQAISRVAQHCHSVRERVKAGVLSVHQRRQGSKESSLGV